MSKLSFLFLEGNPAWLDFVNTQLVEHGRPADRLETFTNLVEWLSVRSLLEPEREGPALEAWEGKAAGREALRRAHEFRAVLRAAAGRLADGDSFPPSAVRAVNEVLARVSGSHRLDARKGRFELRFDAPPKSADDLLEPLARSTAEFLANADLGRVRKCGNPKCILFFYDGTKNQARRWCSMAICGNRMKAATHYLRHREDPKP